MKNKNCIHYFVKYESLEAASTRVCYHLKNALGKGKSTNDLILKTLPLGYYMVASKVNDLNLSDDIEEEFVSRIHLCICEYFYRNPELSSDNMKTIMTQLRKEISKALVTENKGSEDVFDNLEKNELSIPLGYQKSELTATGMISKKALIKELIGDVIRLLRKHHSNENNIGSNSMLYIFRSCIFGIKTPERLSKELGITTTCVQTNYRRAMLILIKNLPKGKISELRSLINL